MARPPRRRGGAARRRRPRARGRLVRRRRLRAVPPPMILAAGEALVEIMRPRPGVPLDRTGEFAGPFASGAPAIFASVAARLGAPTALAAVVGDAPFGALIRDRLRADGVDVSHVRADPATPTGCA